MGNNNWIIALVLIGVFLFATGYLKMPTSTQSVVDNAPNANVPVSGGVACASTGVNTVYAAVQDSQYVGTRYTYAKMDVVGSNGKILGTANSGSGSTLTWTSATATIPCKDSFNTGLVYVIPTTAIPVNSVKAPYNVQSSPTDNVLLMASNASALTMTLYDSTGASNLSTKSATTTTENGAVAMTTGSTRNFFVDVYVNNASAAFGSVDGGILVVGTFNNSAVFDVNDLSLSSSAKPLTPLAVCPGRASSYDNGKRCWTMPQIKASDGTIRIAGVLSSTKGNPGSGDGPAIYFEDVQYLEENGGIAQDTHDNTGTNVGIEKQTVQLTIS